MENNVKMALLVVSRRRKPYPSHIMPSTLRTISIGPSSSSAARAVHLDVDAEGARDLFHLAAGARLKGWGSGGSACVLEGGGECQKGGVRT